MANDLSGAAQVQTGFTTASGAGRSAPDGGVAGMCPGALCPVSTFDGTYVCLNQNCDKIDNNLAVACAGGFGTTPNGYARCFDIAGELGFLFGSFELHSVKWGVQQFDSSTGDIQPITINVYLDSSGTCSNLFANAVLLASGTQLVTVGDAGTVFVTPVVDSAGLQPVIGPNDFIIIEIEAAVDGNLGTPGNNYAFRPRTTTGACSDALIRAASCGIVDWLGVSAIGFPDSQYLIQANGQVLGAAKPLCGNGTLEACEECDPPDGVLCDENCQILVEPPAGPNNDLCADRRPIMNGKTDFDNTLATLDGPACDANMDTDVWWNYIATETGTVDIDTCQDAAATLTDTVLTVYDGCDCTTIHCGADGLPGQELASNDDACGIVGFSSAVKVPVVAGNCYKIQVGGWNGAEGTGTVTITKQAAPGACCLPDGSCIDVESEGVCDKFGGTFQGGGSSCVDADCPPPAPNNDNCADRRPAFQGKTPFTNVGATLDGPACDSSMTGDVWFNYIATETGGVVIDTCQDAASTLTDTVLTVYDGCTPCPVDCSTELASDDDSCGVVNFSSTVKIPVVAGNCYKIQVGGFLGAEGSGTLTITKQAPAGACCLPDGSCIDVESAGVCDKFGGTFQGAGTDCLKVECPQPAPNNDNCADRRPIFNGATEFSTVGASTDGPGVPCTPIGPVNDIWYNYISDFTGEINVTTCEEKGGGANFDTVLVVYDGCVCDPLSPLLGCNDDDPNNPCGTGGGGFHSTVVVPVVAGNCYKIRLGGFSGGSAGTGTLNITKKLPPPGGASLDIKPGSCPNSFNRNGNGVLPVALIGTAAFDVKDVDLDSLLLVRKDGLGGSIAPHEGPPGPSSEFEDVATPFDEGEEQCDCHELEGDGVQDLSLKFISSDLVDALDLDLDDPGALVSLTLIGNLLDGTPFEAEDCIRLVPPGTGGGGLLAVGSNLPGAWLDVSPLDLQLDGGGFANFERTYPQTTVVTLSAPTVFHDWVFFGWMIDGDLYQGQSIDLTILEHLEQIEAIYRPAGQEDGLHKQ